MIVFVRLSVILFAMAALAPQTAAQQAYPNKPVRIIVPYPPGGTADIVGRTIAEKLGVTWGQSVIVENRAGAGGTIGVDAVAKSAPDGYTMVLGVTGPLTIVPSINPQLAYDPLRDLVPITLVAAVPSVIAVHPSVAARDLRELIALAKSQPGKLSFASAGTGTSVHIAGDPAEFKLEDCAIQRNLDAAGRAQAATPRWLGTLKTD